MTATSTRARYRDALPQLDRRPVPDGRRHRDDPDLPRRPRPPDFAAYDLLDARRAARTRCAATSSRTSASRASAASASCSRPPTWRANPDWAERLGHRPSELAELNRGAVALLERCATSSRRRRRRSSISGCVGPRGDGYVVGEAMSADEAAAYHGVADRDVRGDGGRPRHRDHDDLRRRGGRRSCGPPATAGLPVVISFTVETDGRLPSGQPLREAIEEVDARTDGAAAYFMVNCAHPSHFYDVLEPGSAGPTGSAGSGRTPRAEPCRARRGGGARRGRSRGARERVRRAPRAAAAADRARRLLRHRPPPHRRDE